MSSNSNDAGDGSFDNLFATLGRARLAAQRDEGDVNIPLRGGTYTLTGPWSLNHRHSTEKSHCIIYQAFGWDTHEEDDVTISVDGRSLVPKSLTESLKSTWASLASSRYT